MKFASEFNRYRGDGKNKSGEKVITGGEKGRYLADDNLVVAVNTALAVEQPLLVTGEPGTGKTMLAYSVAAELELGDVQLFTVRSDHRGQELIYELDNLQRFYDAQVNDPAAKDRGNYLEFGPLGKAFEADSQKVVLIDEIDKAPRDFPNDLLHALDKMEAVIPELNTTIKAKHKPLVLITSNRESQLPNPFLRRCVFHHIEFPDEKRLRNILSERIGHLGLTDDLSKKIVAAFSAVRAIPDLEKRPSTGEMIAWATVLIKSGLDISGLAEKPAETPFVGALLKTKEDMAQLGDS